jgi:ubiquinone/menaquinone biosynthesis C-methylase UbiE
MQQASAEEIAQRQERERAYHRDYAASQARFAEMPPLMDVLAAADRKWWNSHWRVYDFAMSLDLRGKRVLIPGCGLGEDACRFAQLGAEVYASDLSPDLIEIARARAERFGYGTIRFDAMPAEQMTYPDDFFDVALFHGVFHHISIGPALDELDRVMKPGGILIAHEQYTHSALDGIRHNRFIDGVVYPRLQRRIYGGQTPYITEDEAKLDQHQLDQILSRLTDLRIDWFCLLEGRLFSTHIPWASRLDCYLMRACGPFRRYLAGQAVFAGRWRKSVRSEPSRTATPAP